METGFHGAKAAVFIGSRLLIYQRDRGVAWPGYWDFPGGGRDGDESPKSCLRRELHEEFAIDLPDSAITWARDVPAMIDQDRRAWFFVVHLPADYAGRITFGSEGERWALRSLDDVANMPNLVPALHSRLTLWLRDRGRDPI